MKDIGTIINALKKHYGPGPRNRRTRQDAFKRKRDLREMQNSMDFAFKVLISTVLSQRTRDENTDRAARALFARYSTPESIAKADVRSIKKLIKPAGFYRQKAPRIKKIAETITGKYKGKVPKNMDELLKLPGIGRKTAGCTLLYGHHISCIPVDVHVAMVSKRLGLTKNNDPNKIQIDLERLIPRKHWNVVNQLFVIHGQEICLTRKPRCHICLINTCCDYFRYHK